ncbi:MAG: hypothetical protein Q9179_002621 [Wetmoreana sp. 5 TL-2023]
MLFYTHMLFLALLTVFSRALPPDINSKTHVSELTVRAVERDMMLLVDYGPPGWVAADGETVFPSHSALFIAGNEQDGPLKIEIGNSGNGPENLYIRAFDLTTKNKDKTYASNGMRKVIPQGKTKLTNREFMDPETGKGLVANAWVEDPNYRNGIKNKGNINTCNTFLRRLVEGQLGGQISPEADMFFKKAEKWTEQFNDYGTSQDVRLLRLETATDVPGEKTYKNYDLVAVCLNTGGPPGKQKRAGACEAKVSAADGDKPPSKTDKSAQKNELAIHPLASTMPESELALEQDGDFTDKAPSTDIVRKTAAKISLTRAGGSLTSFTTVGRDVLQVLGIAGTIVGAAFVILDFVEHHWVGGAIGAVGLAAGIAAGTAVSGPLGWIVGGAVAALFAILPGLFDDTHQPADRTDVQGIIQWKLFGDKDHTGNEQCQKGTADVPGNPDCQALYGAGTLSMALGFNNFDAIIFLQQFNDGYAMTIKDMAAAFYVVDPDKEGDGSDKIATIECNNSKGVPGGRAGTVGKDSPKLCNDPHFLIKREMVHLPNINETADKVIDRIIPAPNGDCKLIAYPGDQFFPDYNLTMEGQPSAIACGLTAAINVDGTAIPVEGDANGQKPQTGSDPDQSTDNQGGAFVAPPPRAPFKPLAQTDYLCIIHGSDQPFCLPPGTYRKQSGLGFEIKEVDSLTLPPGGWSLAVHWRWYSYAGPIGYTDRTYSENQDPTKETEELKNFKRDMDGIDMNENGEATFTVVGPNDGPDPVCCLFTKPSFGGNVWCMGVGGDDVLPQWKDKAQSVSCHNGGQVWLYAKEYGDAGAALIKGNVEDLKNEPYGKDEELFRKM